MVASTIYVTTNMTGFNKSSLVSLKLKHSLQVRSLQVSIKNKWRTMGVIVFMGITWFQAPKMAKKKRFFLFAGNESSDSATTDYETLGVCGE